METALLILAALLILTGLVGSFLPVLPGPPLAWLGMLLVKYFSNIPVSDAVFITATVFMVIITVLDYVLPGLLVKWGRGSKAAVTGANIGMLVGIFFGPPGILLGPFVGAFAAEVLRGTPAMEALRPALLAFLGFLCGVFVKLAYAVYLLVDFLIRLF